MNAITEYTDLDEGRHEASLEAELRQIVFIAALDADDTKLEIATLKDRSEELDQLNELFDLQQTRMSTASEAWRAAHPGMENVLPDLGELLQWMLDERVAAEKTLKELTEATALHMHRHHCESVSTPYGGGPCDCGMGSARHG